MQNIINKYSSTIQTIIEIKPVTETISKTKESINNSSIQIQLKVQEMKRQYSNFSAELPPISMTIKTVKLGLGGLFNKYF